MALEPKNVAAARAQPPWPVRFFFWWARVILGCKYLTVHSVNGQLRGITVSQCSYRWLHRPEGEHVCSFLEPPGSWGKAP